MIRHNKGFTLIEVMIVVALIAIISMFAVPSYQNAQRKARINEGIAALTAAQSQIDKYRLIQRKPYDDITLELAKIEPKIKYSGEHIYTMTYTKASEAEKKKGERYTLKATLPTGAKWISGTDPCKELTMDGFGNLKEKAACQK